MAQERDPIDALRQFCRQCGSQRAAAGLLDVSEVFVSDMLAGKRNISPRVLAHLGLRQAVVRVTREKSA